ncbi:MAG TPA: sulfite exporter TauE/SafE family protein [Actinomycetota bacterium]|nr:sulfite exporter TauE/SafE family protein [Actinomycetota bacterium]
MPDVSVVVLVLLIVASVVGGVIQGAIGFGFALVAVPVLGLIRPDAVPVTIMFVALPMSLAMSIRERAHIDRPGFLAIMAGRAAGIFVGVAVLLLVPERSLAIVIGAMVVLAAVLSALGLDLQPKRWLNVGAGVLSGVMGTTAAVGGPALAVVYQRRPGPELRSTLALSYLAGLLLGLAALGAIGRVHLWHFVLALAMVPGMFLGLWLAIRLVGWLDQRWLRPVVLGFAGVSGLVIVVRALLVH